MDTVKDDDTTATVFRALSDPGTLELLLRALSADQHEVRLRPPLEAPPPDVLHLAALVDAGLMTRASGSGLEVYRVSDPAGLQLLLRTARQLHTDRGPR